VIEAARRMGIEVPIVLLLPRPVVAGCVPHVSRGSGKKLPSLQTACTLVRCRAWWFAPALRKCTKRAKGMLEFLLANHPLDCPVCDKGGECECRTWFFTYGADKSRFQTKKNAINPSRNGPRPFITTRRAAFCASAACACVNEGMDVKALGVGARGSHR